MVGEERALGVARTSAHQGGLLPVRETNGIARKDPAMTVKIRQFRTGGFEVDIRFTYPDGSTPAKAIQELAGHADLTTTMRYMHLSPAARQDAIALLNLREEPLRDERANFGDIVETVVSGSAGTRNH
jgi:hypothetical protein